MESEEARACTPHPVDPKFLNPSASIPFECSAENILKSMEDFCSFLRAINQQLHTHQFPRLESFLMPANFSSLVGEFMVFTIPKHCSTLARNTYHNGHPDLLPAGRFPNNSVQYGHEGIEIKSSRYHRGWQGHNAEASWLMVFVFDANRVRDNDEGTPRFRVRRPWVRVLIGIYGLAAFYDFAAGQLAPPKWSLPRIIDVVPGWSWQAWTIVGLAFVLLVVFESAYRLDREKRKLISSHTDPNISSFTRLVRESEGLRIIWANGREPDIDTVCKEAIEWSIRAIKIVGEVGQGFMEIGTIGSTELGAGTGT